MVEAHIDDNTRTGKIVLRPNRSWTWKANLYLLFTLFAVSITIGLGFLLAGAWVILPFSLIEMAAVSGCIYYCVRQCNRQEVITVTEHQVRIEHGIRSPERAWDYHRLWAHFLVQTPRHPGDSAIVSIRSHGKNLELGNFLNQQDKSILIAALKRLVNG